MELFEAKIIRGACPKAVSVLAVGAHPDDVDMGAGGLLLLEAERGRPTGVVENRVWVATG
jgi:hypothetical protein